MFSRSRLVVYFITFLSLLSIAYPQMKQRKGVQLPAQTQTQSLSQSVDKSASNAGQNFLSFLRKNGIAPATVNQTKGASPNQTQSVNQGNGGTSKLQVPSTMPAVIRWNSRFGTPRLIEFHTSGSSSKTASNFSPDKGVSVAEQFLLNNKSLLKIVDPESEFKMVNSTTDKNGFTHVRFQQQFKGMEVWAKDVYVHIDGSGQVSSFNGEYAPTPAISDTAGPVVSSAAVSSAQMDLQSKGVDSSVPEFMKNNFGYSGPAATKVIWYGNMPVAHLAWFVEIRSGIDHDWYYFIDAVDGKILRSYDNVDHDGSVSSSGTDLNGASRSFHTYQVGSTYYMIDATQPMYDAADSKIPDNPVGALQVLNLNYSDASSSSTIYYVTSSNNQWTDASSVSALYNASVTYNFYRTVFNRNSINDSGMTIYSIIHVTENSQPMDNAFWNGYFMCYGDGNTDFKPLAGGLDVAAHEMTHGVTQHSANLEYVDQSGALNESMSDAFAKVVDTTNWTIGASVVKNLTDFPTGALRDLSNPHNGGTSEFDPCWQPATLAEYVSTTQDNGGVHVNSGIPNHAFYLVAKNIGRTEARQIWYKALTSYLTRSSQFVDARIATVSAAGELFGQSSSEVTAVKSAWTSVGVSDSVGTSQPPASMVVGPSYVLLTNTSSSDPNSLYMAKSEAVSNSDFFPLSQTTVANRPAVSDTGQIVLFVDGNNRLKALYTNPQNPDEQYIDTNEVWWSVAIGPGLSSIALTSIYIDTTIYYFDLANSTSVKFKVVTQSYDGPNTKTALYADALSFDPTGNYLLFDAYNQIIGSQGDTISYWNIGLINVSTSSISTVFPPQSQGTNLGDPVFSKTTTNRFAFDYWDEGTGQDYVMAADLSTGDIGTVAGPQDVLGYPSYSPDDDSVAYSTTMVVQSAEHYSINEMPLLSDKIDGDGSPFGLATDAMYPVWFAIGQRVTAEHDRPSTPLKFELGQNYPNPFNPSTVIGYQLAAVGHVTLSVYDILGRKVMTLVDGVETPGNHEVRFDGSSLASGVYFYRLTTDNFSATKKLVLMK
ncbi:MAG TPA: M4 family metallopeptidase [Candidatus Acidoferrales bacterium]|nr:M4 family metallopeptidase [Candidatus Acidoferrales bacterium]